MNYKHRITLIATGAIALLSSGGYVNAQAVVFPQQQQPGIAVMTQTGESYTLANDLLSATFTEADGKLLFDGCEALGLKPGADLFSILLGDNTTLTSSAMTLGEVKTVVLGDEPSAAVASRHLPGHALEATYSMGDLNVVWRAVLRDGSHYLRTEMEISTDNGEGTAMQSITPMAYRINTEAIGTPEVVGNTRGAVLLSDKIFAGLETPMGLNSCGPVGSMVDSDFTLTSWNANSFNWRPTVIPSAILNLSGGYSVSDITATAGYANFAEAGETTVTFLFSSGSHRLNIVGVDLVNNDGDVVASDYHYGYTGGYKQDNVYTLNVPAAGTYIIRYFMETKTETITSSGNISFSSQVTQATTGDVSGELQILGVWERPTTLPSGRTWKISSVVGLIAPDHARRSFLAYSERERAVPWRSFPHYNSWYELNIDRNNSSTYDGHMTIDDCMRVASQWKENLYDKHDVEIQAIVLDDGWDSYGTWTFNPGFPNGFSELDVEVKNMHAGIGAWLGPVGGYGGSGNYRRQYWSDKGGMTLANPAYYKVFLDACTHMVTNYDFRFFKFDGISAQGSSVGPDSGDAGIEKAEGIIQLEQDVREIKPDIFLNTTVGTWASPFWFRYTDAVWRQEADWQVTPAKGIQASCNDRERWITYRDRLVYQNFVQNSPICPINTIMTHGFILTKFGNVSRDFTYKSILNELRCAFACGSGMVELYADYELLNKAYADGNGQEGQLWGDIAELIKWHEANADVLPDIHWVGGNPCDRDTGTGEVYGWGAWNGSKVVLTLRNPNGVPTAFRGTLREALDIPEYVNDAIILTKPFDDQPELIGLSSGEALDIDAEINVMLPANGVYMFNGEHTTEAPVPPMPSVEFITPEEPEETDCYPVNFPKDLTIARDDRILNSFTLVAEGESPVSIGVGDKTVYHNNVSDEVSVKAGAVITPTVSYTGRAMHTYWYVDLNNDGAFSYTINDDGTPSGELLSYSCYQNKNSLGEAVSTPGSLTPATNQPFSIPANTAAGVYRCRFKIDWNNVDPGGQYGSNNQINDNGGYIVDFMIHVYDDKATVSAVLPEKHTALVTLASDHIGAETVEIDRLVTLSLNSTTLEKGKIIKLKARSGYNLESNSYKFNGNPTWREFNIPERGNGTFNVPFDLVDRPMILTAEVDDSTGIHEVILTDKDIEIYDLRGIKVKNPGAKGIYIVNGKKVIF